jgi:hypothetical protein
MDRIENENTIVGEQAGKKDDLTRFPMLEIHRQTDIHMDSNVILKASLFFFQN